MARLKSSTVFRVASLFILFLMTLMSLNACQKKNTSVSGSRDPLGNEALEIAKQVFSKKSVTCGDLTYLRTWWNLVGDRYYVRSRNVQMSVNPYNLSAADKLNGVEWRGEITLQNDGPCQTANQFKGYGEWQDICAMDVLIVKLEKKGGKWIRQDSDAGLPQGPPLTCEEVLNPTHRAAGADSGTAAVVGQSIITSRDFFTAYDKLCQFYKNRGELNPELEKQLGQKALDSMVDKQVALVAAAAMGITASEKEIENDISHDPNFMKNGRFDEQVYLSRLKLNRLTPEQFKKEKGEEMIIAKFSSNTKGNPREAIEEQKKKISITINQELINNARCSQ